MNTPTFMTHLTGTKTSLTLVIASALLLTACASSPVSPSGSVEVRERLTQLQNNPQVADNARTELRDAEEAVRIAEQPLRSNEEALGDHRVYMADSMIEIARAKAATRQAESERALMSEEREAARLAARTLEADRSRAEADRSRAALTASALTAEELQRRIDEMEARPTDRGLVLTLGDVLFATGSADIQGGSNQNLDRLVDFLKAYPERYVLIEGHTDNVGSAPFNQTLSQQRAESVSRYLTDQGIQRSRLSAHGFGLERPIASNDSSSGRQQNRRVEVIIEN